MGAAFTFCVTGKIEPAVRMTQRSKYQNVYAGRSLAYKEQIGWAARTAGAVMRTGPVSILVIATAHRRQWDASNVLKLAEDALNGICWLDDKQVTMAGIVVVDIDARGTDELRVSVREVRSSLSHNPEGWGDREEPSQCDKGERRHGDIRDADDDRGTVHEDGGAVHGQRRATQPAHRGT